MPWTAGQTYHYRITLTDPSGNVTNTGDYIYRPTTTVSVITAARAAQNPVTSTSIALSALGSVPQGESALTYTWSASGPAAVTFGVNGTNAAKNTVASFSRPGSYSIQVMIADGLGNRAASVAGITVNQTPNQVLISPSSAALKANQTQQFTASVLDQFGSSFSQAAITWTATGGGTLSSTGLYTAGSTTGGPFTYFRDGIWCDRLRSSGYRVGTDTANDTSEPAPVLFSG